MGKIQGTFIRNTVLCRGRVRMGATDALYPQIFELLWSGTSGFFNIHCLESSCLAPMKFWDLTYVIAPVEWIPNGAPAMWRVTPIHDAQGQQNLLFQYLSEIVYLRQQWKYPITHIWYGLEISVPLISCFLYELFPKTYWSFKPITQNLTETPNISLNR